MITETFECNAIPVADCRAQGHNDEANMLGKCNSAQTIIIKEQYPTAIFSACGGHTLNLCDDAAAECITEAIIYFGAIQTI